MSLNKIVKGKDNPVIINFTFGGDFEQDGLNTFTEIVLTIGGETYSTNTTPNNLVIVNNSQLKLIIGDVTSLNAGYYIPEIVGFNTTNYDDGYLLSGKCNNVLGSGITVC